MSCQYTFERYEKKYLMEYPQYQQFRRAIEGHVRMDEYGECLICNIYYDTFDYRMIQKSLEKPFYKEKLRQRSYGVPTKEDITFIEIKKKYDGVVYKRRMGIKLEAADEYLNNKKRAVESDNPQVQCEVDWLMQYYKTIHPVMYISYERKAYCGMQDESLRLTFDKHIIWRETDLQLEKGVYGHDLLKEGQRLLEIKIPGTMPLWLTHALDCCKAYPISFSKYGNCYKEIIRQMQGGGEACA